MVAVFGLGNPGPRYAGTRHNVGVRVLELLVARWRARPEPAAAEYRWWRAEHVGREVGLVVPLTFMNASGGALRAWLDRHGLEPEGLLVVVDDVYLPIGTLRLRARGSSGGHRGLESIEAALGGRDYARLRVGVGAAADAGALREHVLEDFDQDEEEGARTAVDQAADAVECWLKDGVKAAMNRFNRKVRKEALEP